MPVLEAIATAAVKAAEVTVEVAGMAAEATAEVAGNAAETAVEAAGKVSDSIVEGTKEVAANSFELIGNTKDIVAEKLSSIKSTTPEQLREQMDMHLSEANSAKPNEAKESTKNTEGLTNEQKQRIKEETGWSDEIINSISSLEEYEIYKKAGLVEAEIDGKKCLIRSDIDWNQKDALGRTNYERVEQGLSPLNKDGKPIELHHIGQHSNSPLAELTQEEHRGKGNDGILHNKSVESEINRNAFAFERSQHWRARMN